MIRDSATDFSQVSSAVRLTFSHWITPCGANAILYDIPPALLLSLDHSSPITQTNDNWTIICIIF